MRLLHNEEVRISLILVLLTAVLTIIYELLTTWSITQSFANLCGRVAALFSFNSSGLLPFATISIAVMGIVMVLLAVERERTQKKLRGMNYTRKLPVEVYDRLKEKQTKIAVRQLKSSELYKKYLQDKKEGRIKDIVLSDDDKVEFSGEENEIGYK